MAEFEVLAGTGDNGIERLRKSARNTEAESLTFLTGLLLSRLYESHLMNNETHAWLKTT